MCHLTLGYDHRLIDGAEAGRFLSFVKERLENFDEGWIVSRHPWCRALEVRRLGVVPYAEALELQQALVEERKAGPDSRQLLLLEHPPVITLGVQDRNDRSHTCSRRDETLATQRRRVFETGRGGDVTYHGPGQLVGYPILDLQPDRCDVHRYVRDLEEVLIRDGRRRSA